VLALIALGLLGVAAVSRRLVGSPLRLTQKTMSERARPRLSDVDSAALADPTPGPS
jgi:hypothetical protein